MKKDNQPDISSLRRKAKQLLRTKMLKTDLKQADTEALKLIHELEVYQIELELQNEELKKAIAATQIAVDLYNFAPTGYFTLSKEGRILELNLCGSQLIGKDRFRLIGSNFAFFVSDDTKPIFHLFFEKVVKSNVKETCEITLLSTTNSPIYVHLTGIVTTNSEQCLLTMVNITELKKSEAALHESELQFRNLANSDLALIWTSGTDKRCNYFNEAWLKFTGRTLKQEIGNGWAEGVHPDDFDACLNTYVKAFNHREPFKMEYRLRDASGEYRWLLDLGTPNYNCNGEFIGYIGHCFDISDRKLSEAALQTKVDELMNFHRLTIGRELTMVELKKEVNELLIKTGQPIKYLRS